jgi:hypothetical protein
MSRIETGQPGDTHRLPTWFRGVGALAAAGATSVAGELTYEQTVLTWANGPPVMVGFSLAHSDRHWILFPCVVVLAVWTPALFAWSGVALWRGARIAMSRWAALVLAGAVLAILFVPYGAWQSLFVDRIAKGPAAAEHLADTAATGNLATLKALVARGVSVDARDHQGATALHAAAVGGQLAVAEYLVSKGADVNALNRYGDSPLENAVSAGRTDVARFLESRGARKTRGSDAVRERARAEIVREQIERLDSKASK